MAPMTMTVSGVEVSGETVLAIIKGMGGFRKRLRHVLAEHGLDKPKPNHWYSQDELLGVFDAIAAGAGPFTIFNMGTRVAEDTELPAGIDSVEKALAQMDAFYRGGHRGEKVDGYAFEKTGENSGAIVCKTPYPCDFDRGLIETVAQRSRPRGSRNVTVEHDDSAACRKRGGDRCTYLVRW